MSDVILPGATIGFLGGGQLGRMTALAARSMGYDVQVLDPDPACSARPVASRTITAKFDDVAAAVDLASQCDVVTLEIEQIHPDVLDAVAAQTTLHPKRNPIFIIQDRIRQKQWLRDQGFPLGKFAVASSQEGLQAAVTDFKSVIAKSTHGGYDGRGQVRITEADQSANAWNQLGAEQCLVEQLVSINCEISVLVARSQSGQVAIYPPSRNHHTRGVLTWAVIPALISYELSLQAQKVAQQIAECLDIVGLLAVEFFVTNDGELLVNELAPRPHNTYHHSERGLATSQFEQLVRAICNLPLGAVDVFEPSAIVNLLGEVWLQEAPPRFTDALAVEGTRLHLYGKQSARAGRKMGHISAVGGSSQNALGRVLSSYRILSEATKDLFDVEEPTLSIPVF